jgi:hypothetical protein
MPYMSIQYEFNNNGLDHHVDLKNRNGDRCEKTREKRKWIIITDEAFSNRHEKIAF